MMKWIWIGGAGLAALFLGSRAAMRIGGLRSSLFGGLTAADLKYAIEESKKAELDPPQRSVSGATNLYLEKIKRDFPDFHLPEAKTAVSLLVQEALEIRYTGKTRFTESYVEDDLAASIEKSPSPRQLDSVEIHTVTIANYVKTKEYATITYQASAGYRLDGKKIETRYEIDSTIKFIDEASTHLLTCKNCGGVIESTAQKVCAYCGSGIVWDTRLSWRFTAITEK